VNDILDLQDYISFLGDHFYLKGLEYISVQIMMTPKHAASSLSFHSLGGGQKCTLRLGPTLLIIIKNPSIQGLIMNELQPYIL
jgi:hypothetical protein